MSTLRIALHSGLREHGDQATAYREAADLFARAEELGFDSRTRPLRRRRRGHQHAVG